MKTRGERINSEETRRTHIYDSGQELSKTRGFADEIKKDKKKKKKHTIYLKHTSNDLLRGSLKLYMMAFSLPLKFWTSEKGNAFC